jgi:hypothetical protein
MRCRRRRRNRSNDAGGPGEEEAPAVDPAPASSALVLSASPGRRISSVTVPAATAAITGSASTA